MDEGEGDGDKLDIRVWLNKWISWLGSHESFIWLVHNFSALLPLEPLHHMCNEHNINIKYKKQSIMSHEEWLKKRNHMQIQPTHL